MNPNWTGRSARTLSECRFTEDADPFERDRSKDYSYPWWIAIWIIIVISLLLIVHTVAP